MVRDLHSLKTFFPRLVIDGGIITWLNEVQLLNALSSMHSMFLGISIRVKDVHIQKAFLPMNFKKLGNKTWDNDVQSMKDSSSTWVKNEGLMNVIADNEQHPLNDFLPILCNEEGNSTLSKDLHSANAYSSIL